MTGATGPQGSPGSTGPAGATGQTGAAGISVGYFVEQSPNLDLLNALTVSTVALSSAGFYVVNAYATINLAPSDQVACYLTTLSLGYSLGAPITLVNPSGSVYMPTSAAVTTGFAVNAGDQIELHCQSTTGNNLFGTYSMLTHAELTAVLMGNINNSPVN
jgi:hypothetical protein